MDPSDLKDRNILVTGVTSGLGREIAYRLATLHGAHVIGTGRRDANLDSLEREISVAGGGLSPVVSDLTQKDDIARVIEISERKGVDGVILNAGVTSACAFVDGSTEDDERLIATNVSANLALIRGLLPYLKQRQGARILLVASLGGLVPLPYQAVYAGTKAFIVNFGLSLREELKTDGVTVSVFAPGGIKTEMTDIDALDGLKSQLAPVGKVADAAISTFLGGGALSVPGVGNKIMATGSKVLPRSVVGSMLESVYRRARKDD